jgi:hypothetical protein
MVCQARPRNPGDEARRLWPARRTSLTGRPLTGHRDWGNLQSWREPTRSFCRARRRTSNRPAPSGRCALYIPKGHRRWRFTRKSLSGRPHIRPSLGLSGASSGLSSLFCYLPQRDRCDLESTESPLRWFGHEADGCNACQTCDSGMEAACAATTSGCGLSRPPSGRDRRVRIRLPPAVSPYLQWTAELPAKGPGLSRRSAGRWSAAGDRLRRILVVQAPPGGQPFTRPPQWPDLS